MLYNHIVITEEIIDNFFLYFLNKSIIHISYCIKAVFTKSIR